MTAQTLTKRQKVALLLQTLGSEQAQQIIKQLDPGQAASLTREMDGLAQLSHEAKRTVLREFRQLIARDGKRNAEKMSATGPVRSNAYLATILPSRAAELLQSEPPRIIALMLLTAPAELRDRIQQQLPIEMQQQVASLLGEVTPPSSELREQLDHALRAKAQDHLLETAPATQPEAPVDAVTTPLDIPTTASTVQDTAEPKGHALTAAAAMAIEFYQLDQLPNPVVQSLLRQVKTPLIVAALRGADKPLAAFLLQAMPLNRRIIVQGILNANRPLRLGEILKAQQFIARVANRTMAELARPRVSMRKELVHA